MTVVAAALSRSTVLSKVHPCDAHCNRAAAVYYARAAPPLDPMSSLGTTISGVTPRPLILNARLELDIPIMKSGTDFGRYASNRIPRIWRQVAKFLRPPTEPQTTAQHNTRNRHQTNMKIDRLYIVYIVNIPCHLVHTG
jgi:hypothetical protein